ncbi:unnamed protein product [Penicillium olsonii]|uniref:Alcohol acetyltransferase n=1 Tax=Penicillium olsonii TaxID=99116 RepID=A0A9W4HN48_PENOL|nr:unnamed protein product [Penicillium olsonii]
MPNMPDTKFMRFASPNERRTISREDVGFYNALIIAGLYEIQDQDVDLNSPHTFIQPLKHCVEKHPFLSVIVKNKHTEQPAFEAVSEIDLRDHIVIIEGHQTSDDAELDLFEKVLPPILDRPWPTGTPPWRIIVLPLASLGTSQRCLMIFSFSHTLGDGMSAVEFHRTFLDGWRQAPRVDQNESHLVSSPNDALSEPFDTPARLPISWSFLLAPLVAVYLPHFVANLFGLKPTASPVNAGTWTGSSIFFKPPPAPPSRLRILEIDHDLVQTALRVSRIHNTKLTATMHQFIVRALSKAISDTDVTNFVSGTAVDMRKSIGISSATWGLFVNAHYETHPRSREVGQTLSDQAWAAASSMTEKLAECGTRLQDQAVGLLRYAPSIRNWTLSKIGKKRDCSYELSNLLAFDDRDGDASHGIKIEKMMFTRPANPISAPLEFNVVSVKGGSLMCIVSWQAGALDIPVEDEMPLVDEILRSVRADFEALKD